jgi:sulfoxide reductase catalytic subunit YedY
VTPAAVYFNRRMFIRAGVLAASAVATGMVYRRLNPVASGKVTTPVIQGLVTATPTEAANGFRVDEPETPFQDITHYNNFYEFSTDKKALLQRGQIRNQLAGVCRGLVGNPGRDLDAVRNQSAGKNGQHRCAAKDGPW